jgi:hypothetical protein
MVKQFPGSASELRSSSLGNLNNTHRPSAKSEHNHTKSHFQSYDYNRFLLYPPGSKFLNIYHQNIVGLQGKINELISSLHLDLPHVLCFTEHHLNYNDVNCTHIEHYNLSGVYCIKIYDIF